MNSNPELPFSSAGVNLSAEMSASSSSPSSASRFTVWTHRTSLVILVVFCLELGMLLTVLPWTKVWTENSLLFAYPSLLWAFRNEFLRGAITGLGLIDIWIGIGEAVHYVDPGKKAAS